MYDDDTHETGSLGRIGDTYTYVYWTLKGHIRERGNGTWLSIVDIHPSKYGDCGRRYRRTRFRRLRWRITNDFQYRPRTSTYTYMLRSSTGVFGCLCIDQTGDNGRMSTETLTRVRMMVGGCFECVVSNEVGDGD